MLIFDSKALAGKSIELELAEQRESRLNSAAAAVFCLGALTIFGSLAAAAFNAVLPLFGMISKIDTWGNPEFIFPQLAFALGSFVATVIAICIIGPYWDRAQSRVKELRAKDNQLELSADFDDADMVFECRFRHKQDYSEYSYGTCPHC